MSAERASVTVRLPSFGWVSRGLASGGRGVRRLGSGRGLLVAMVLVVALVAANLVIGWRSHEVRGDQEARAAALESARARVSSMLSYDYRSLDADLSVAVGNTTGQFRSRYAELLTKVVGPHARRQKIVTEAEVTQAGVVRGDTSAVRLLVFLTQRTRAGGAKEPTVTRSRLTVDMAKTAKGWFVTGFKPA